MRRIFNVRLSFSGFLSFMSFLLVFVFVITGHGTTEIITTNTPQVAGASVVTYSESGDEFIDAINKIRVDNNVTQVYKSESLINVATSRSSDMLLNNYYAHSNSKGQNYSSFMPVLPNYSCENLNLGNSSDVLASIDAWLNSSSGHKECLLNPKVQFVGYNVVNLDKLSEDYITVAIFSN